MKLRINQIKISVEKSDESSELERVILKRLKIHKKDLVHYKIVKKSIDARKKPDIYYVYSVDVDVKEISGYIHKDKNISVIKNQKKYSFKVEGTAHMSYRPIVVGFGPGGMFCGYMLAKYGYKPIIIERGSNVDTRIKEVEEFWKSGVLNTDSNIQFGEGGAGTFSDGKLNTTVNDKQFRNTFVLETLVKFGAPENILYDAKPHIGTDILCNVVKNMRNAIIDLGGEVCFNKVLTGINFSNNKVDSVVVNNMETIKCETVVLAIGHSARDTFIMLDENNVTMEAKPFAIGVRIEHRQEMINESMYGKGYNKKLPASPYKLTGRASDGRGVYSFCMCPGGYVVNASSEAGMTAINGMSYNKRDGENANSAIVTTVHPSDYMGIGPLRGMYFQRELEKKTYIAGKGKIPVQRYGDYIKNITTSKLGKVNPNIKGDYEFANIREILPDYISKAIEECMPFFAKKINGFDDSDSIMSAIESRTSSPVRIVRNDLCESVSHIGIYPCGEGAGYAGGITSAAIDGIKVFEAIATKYNNDF